MEVDSGYVNLDYVVSLLIMENNMDDRWKEKLLQIAISGYSQLDYTDVITTIKTASITVNNQNVAPFPRDYISYISIALEHEGREVPLTLNRNITLPRNQSCGEWQRTSLTSTNQQFDDTSGYFVEDYEGNLVQNSSYTIGGGFNAAYYRIDEQNKQIIFLKHNMSGLTINLNYKGSGITAYNAISRSAVPALQAFIEWRIKKNDKSFGLGEVEMAKREWITERGKLYARNHAFTFDEFLDLVYENMHRGLK